MRWFILVACLFLQPGLLHGQETSAKPEKPLPVPEKSLRSLQTIAEPLSARPQAQLPDGRAPELDDERLLSFQFPERPGALLNFLEQISGRWNISLFHYRNHGSDFGRVLCGLQVPEETEAEFAQFLADLGYYYSDQSNNPFNELFLS